MTSSDDIYSSIDYAAGGKCQTAGVELDHAEKVTTHIQGGKGRIHLCKLLRTESDFLPKLGFDPVFIHPPDDCEDVAL